MTLLMPDTAPPILVAPLVLAGSAHLFAGKVRGIAGTSRRTAMVKHPLPGPVALELGGLEPDRQSDRRVHGGPDKALCLFPAQHYKALAARFPEAVGSLAPGGLGENISVDFLTEATAVLGSRWRLGPALLEISEPRQPCFKTDLVHGAEDLGKAMAEGYFTGWYFRVIETATVGPEEKLSLVSTPAHGVSVRRIWELGDTLRPDPAELDLVAAIETLPANWRKKLAKRAGWLRANA